MRRNLTLCVALSLVGGCATQPMDCGAPPGVAGTWSYSGTETDPTPAALSGTLALTQPGSCTLGGTLVISVDNGDGSPEQLSGGISGVFLDESTVDLSVDLGGERRHLATVAGDTISGTWVNGATGANGAFRAERGTP